MIGFAGVVWTFVMHNGRSTRILSYDIICQIITRSVHFTKFINNLEYAFYDIFSL